MKPTELAHLIQAQIVRPGDIALDATAGNGHDTLFLAGLVGEGGRVFAFDVQEAASAQTMARLGGAGLAERVTFCLQNHADLAAALPADPPLRAAMFNLGYLPGSDKAVATRPGDTLAAIRAALALLDKAGCATVVAYPGHEGGTEETAAVRALIENLPAAEFRCAEYRLINAAGANEPPILFAIFKR